MKALHHLGSNPPPVTEASHPAAKRRVAGCLPLGPAIVLTALASVPAHAADGCQVLLCLAAPSWRAISQCVPPIRQVLRDLARGKAFPTCAMGGAGQSANHTWANAPSFCPPQYTWVSDGPNGPVYRCQFTGAISVTIQNTLFSRTWWSYDGDAVTEFSAAAKGQLGHWDPRFDDDYAAWLASHPAPVLSMY